jgi:hypothetical protein
MPFADRLGIGGLIVALLGIAAFYLWPEKKWIGLTCLGLAIAVAVVWLWLEFGSYLIQVRSRHLILTSISAFIVAGCLGLAIWRMLIPSPPPITPSIAAPKLEVWAMDFSDHPPKDANLGGIKWKDSYSDGRLYLCNNSDVALVNVDFWMSSNQDVEQIGLFQPYPGVNLTVPVVGSDAFTVFGVDGKPISPVAVKTNMKRIHCDKIFPHSKLEIVMAVSHRKPPEMMKIWGSYYIGDEKHQITNEENFFASPR